MKKLSPALLERMKKVTDEDIETRRKESKLVENASRRRVPGRKCSSDIIVFESHEDDDVMVQEIKRAVNEAQITLDQIYAKVTRATGWNYYYSVLTRHKTTMESFQAWAELLEMETVVKLVPHDEY
jgi:hypothetical protein